VTSIWAHPIGRNIEAIENRKKKKNTTPYLLYQGQQCEKKYIIYTFFSIHFSVDRLDPIRSRSVF
jgi:hypothetical protein